MNGKIDKVYVYICKNFPFDGISDPLILRFDPDIDLMFCSLLHELVHVNLMNKKISAWRKKIDLLKPGHEGLEVVISTVVKHALSKFWEKEKIERMISKDVKLHKAHEKMWQKVEDLNWNLFKTPLIKYLEKLITR